jgi:hypothetical protein
MIHHHDFAQIVGDRNGVIAGDWKEAFATFALVVAALTLALLQLGSLRFQLCRGSFALMLSLLRLKAVGSLQQL